MRTVPCPPELTALLNTHLSGFGTGPDGRLFVGERNTGELPKLTIVRAWQRARTDVFTEEVAATLLARSPYDLRHAAVSTWLNGGVPATTVAGWGWPLRRGAAHDLRQVPGRETLRSGDGWRPALGHPNA
ncbi:MAG TPA: hypothetical protein VLJ59_20950 [Mycobacteriales bacterium]|nr:hypothetical protein [Mycobacteriales bacterium]